MELCVDLIEITRIPYHELETVYISANLAVIPNGSRIKTKISNGNKSVKFTPHKFTFLVEDPTTAALVVTVFSQLTDNRQFAVSYVSIPIKSVPYNVISCGSLKTTLLSPYSVSPIVTLSIGPNIGKNSPHKALKHPDIVQNIDYSNYEDAPIIEFNSFGKLKPPQHYIEKCTQLVEENQAFFLGLIKNDSLRKFLLDKASEFYAKSENCIKIMPKKKISIKSHPKCDHPPQPPNDPPNPRRIRSDDSEEGNIISNASQFVQSPNPPTIATVSTVSSSVVAAAAAVGISVGIPSNSNVNQNIGSNATQSINSNMERNQNEAINSQPIKTNLFKISNSKKAQTRTGPKIQQLQQQQIQQVQMQHVQHKNESPPKSFMHSLDPLDKKIRSKPQPPPDVEIQKPMIKKKPNEHDKTPMRGLLQPKLVQEDKSSQKKINRSICVSKQKQKIPEDMNDFETPYDYRTAGQLMPMGASMMKPKPPPQMQAPLVPSQQNIDTGTSPRRSRQTPEF